MIRLEDITKFYSNRFVKTFVLRHVNLEVAAGEFVTVMGPSGAGKSTLLHILGLLDAASEGRYFFQGQPVHGLKEAERTALQHRHMGFIFQQYHLIDDMTVYENIEAPLLYKKVKAGERQSLVAEMLDRFNMVAKKDLFPNQLSGGEQERVAIARAIVNNPPIILADEPTGNLDSETADGIMDLLKQLNREENMTVLQVTHSEEKAAYGDRIVHLRDGWIESET